MRLDIELNETEIHVIRLALADSWEAARRQAQLKLEWQYPAGHVESLVNLEARFKDLASIPTP